LFHRGMPDPESFIFSCGHGADDLPLVSVINQV